MLPGLGHTTLVRLTKRRSLVMGFVTLLGPLFGVSLTHRPPSATG